LERQHTRPRPHPHSFPTRRSSDLGRQREERRTYTEALRTAPRGGHAQGAHVVLRLPSRKRRGHHGGRARRAQRLLPNGDELLGQDRKSTRLNSSHLGISYAVFCWK